MAYWDTSCLIKLYAPEPDSADFKLHILNGASVVTSEIARLELWAALRPKEAATELLPGGASKALATFDADVAAAQIFTKAIDPAVISKFEGVIETFFSRLPPLPLRTLDAIHISTAAVAGELEIVATDKRLRDAATILGFRVYPPP